MASLARADAVQYLAAGGSLAVTSAKELTKPSVVSLLGADTGRLGGGNSVCHVSGRSCTLSKGRVRAATDGGSQVSSEGQERGRADPARERDAAMMMRAVELAGASTGLTAPHPNAGCVLIAPSGTIVGEGFQYAQGTTSAEVLAVQLAREEAQGGTAYLNLEPGDCHGDNSAVEALVQGGVKRVVMGMRHPLPHLWGTGVKLLEEAGVHVDVFGDGGGGDDEQARVLSACRDVNAPLLFRAAHKVPFSVLKYAMTLDGKIAASTGHAAWVTSKQARQRVFATRAQSDAIIVGGNTVRRDDPRLTTRQEGGHVPIRIVMSRTLRLPEDANLWDVSHAPTIVMTQRGARGAFQRDVLTRRGVEVVEFDFLTPGAVMDYCYQRGFLRVLWECGGTLSAPVITGGLVHKVMAFVAPKLIGGVTAPTPVGELGFVEMTQALNLSDVSFEQVGPDMLITGYLHPLPPAPPSQSLASSASASSSSSSSSIEDPSEGATCQQQRVPLKGPGRPPEILFYKAWDEFGAFSNFSPHPIAMPVGFGGGGGVADAADAEGGGEVTWRSVEHFYQAQKFAGVDHPLSAKTIEDIRAAESPEEAARIGRRMERRVPESVQKDWGSVKLTVMEAALRQKFSTYPALRALLLSTGGSALVESSPHDYFWGVGRTNTGTNHLGKLLMRLRSDLEGRGQGKESSSLHARPDDRVLRAAEGSETVPNGQLKQSRSEETEKERVQNVS
eukprot:jgi/Mesen1/2188/ME000152S01278